MITPALLRRWPLPKLDGEHGKKERGLVLVVGGSSQIPGAVILAAVGALRAGAGTLQIATSRSVATAVAVAVPEARVIGLRETRSGEIAARSCSELHVDIGLCDALLVGPGMRDPAAAIALIERCLRDQAKAALVVDAAALGAFASSSGLRGPHGGGVIVTPHAGEMARLWGVSREDVAADPRAIARAAAVELNAIVALKGAHTYVAAPDGATFHNTAGNLGLGTSGSGDTLAGVITGLCARGADPLQAAVWGVFLHARAGEVLARELGPLGFLARELLTEIPPLLAALGR
ncbi:MAG TPA: NAD(P)H-hydrate dehydratase [Polyangiales bacterium]|nr:NAD(P)H-hydrate dehydratase [Polyangiales bacterium]